MYRQDDNSGLSGWLWCVILSIVVGFLIACALLVIDDQRDGDLLYRNDLDPQAKQREEFNLVVVCSATACGLSLIGFGIWKAVSYYNSPEQERKRIRRRHPPLYGRQ
jgi:hypothetical protein